MKVIPPSSGSVKKIRQRNQPKKRGRSVVRSTMSRRGTVLWRIRLDLIALLLSLLLVVFLLGFIPTWSALIGTGLDVDANTLARWTGVTFPASAMLMFLLSMLQRQPWLAGLAGAVVASLLPHMELPLRLALYFGVTIAAGIGELYLHRHSERLEHFLNWVEHARRS